MTALIKSGDQRLARIRTVAVGPQSPSDNGAFAAPSPSELRITELEQALFEAQARLDVARRESEERLDAARADAHAKGVAAGRAASDELLRNLADAADDAGKAARAALRDAAVAGLAIARASLAQIFTETAPWASMVADIVDKRRAAIEDALVVRIRVSAKDFPDEVALQQLRDGLDILADPGLAPGECLFELRLGEVEVGPRLQGQHLLAFLDAQFAHEAVA